MFTNKNLPQSSFQFSLLSFDDVNDDDTNTSDTNDANFDVNSNSN